jgi:adenylate cyclase
VPRSSTAPRKRKAEARAAARHSSASLSIRLGAVCALLAGLLVPALTNLPPRTRVALGLLAGIAIAFYGVLEACERQSERGLRGALWLATLFEASLPAAALVILQLTADAASAAAVLPVAAVVLLVIASRLRPALVLLGGALAALAIVAVSLANQGGGPLPLALTIGTAWMLLFTLATLVVTRKLRIRARAWRVEQARSRRVERELERYLSPDVARSILDKDCDPDTPERLTATILFCDLRGFTFMCERERPEDVVDLLNTVYDGACKIIQSHGGTVNKFLGDGLLALFGAPHPMKDHAQAAASAAREIQQLVRYLRERGGVWTHLAIGMGIDTGEVVAGPIGSTDRVEYTAIGSPVNRAARLQGLAERDSHRIIVSAHTAKLLSSTARLKELGDVELKGFSRAETVYSLR